LKVALRGGTGAVSGVGIQAIGLLAGRSYTAYIQHTVAILSIGLTADVVAA